MAEAASESDEKNNAIREDSKSTRSDIESDISSDAKPKPPQYWREDYNTTFTAAELLKKEKESKALEEKTSVVDR